MSQIQIIQQINKAGKALGIALMEMYQFGFVMMDKRWIDDGCDPAHHVVDLAKVLDTQTVGGMHFLACGCVVFMTNEHVYLNQCGEQHDEEMSSADIAQKLVDFDPYHYTDIDTHPIPFNLDVTEHPKDTLLWEMFQESIKDVKFDFEGKENG